MESPAETPTEKRYRMVCDLVNDRLGNVMKQIQTAGRIPDGFEIYRGEILGDLAKIQGILFKVCSAGVKKDRNQFLDILIEDYKEIPK